MNDAQRAYDRFIGPIEDRMIRSIWRIIRDRQDAEDAMQDALIRIWKRWHRVCKHQNPEALVLKICIDAAYDLTRRRLRERRNCELVTMANEPVDSSPSPSDILISTEQYGKFLSAIHRLPRQQALATLMRMVQDQSYEEVAAALGCSEATARKHVSRGRDRLRVLLAHMNNETTTGNA